jgi:hypothetical protein
MQASAKQFADDRTNTGSFSQRTFPLQQAITDLTALGTKGGGPGADTANEINSFLQTTAAQFGLPAPPTVKPNDIATFDEATKYLTQYATQRASALGTGSSDYLAVALTGNPNMKMSNLAAQDVARATMGVERMNQAKVLEFQNLHPEGANAAAGDYADWAANWSKDQDIRAYALDVMTPDARTKLLDSLKPGSKEEQRFAQSLATAEQLGLVTKPGAPSGQ